MIHNISLHSSINIRPWKYYITTINITTITTFFRIPIFSYSFASFLYNSVYYFHVDIDWILYWQTLFLFRVNICTQTHTQAHICKQVSKKWLKITKFIQYYVRIICVQQLHTPYIYITDDVMANNNNII